MKKLILTANDKVPPTIKYIGIWNLLDILMKKIDKETDIEKVRTYCQLYKMIYELKGVEQRVSEERLQEIKDSVDFQYKLAKVKCIDNALLFADEERELIEEIERLNNKIEKLEQENAVLKTQVVNKDKYSYGIR